MAIRALLEGTEKLLTDADRVIGAAYHSVPDAVRQALERHLAQRELDLALALAQPITKEQEHDRPPPGAGAFELARLRIAELVREIGPKQLLAIQEQLAALAQLGPTPEILSAIGRTTGLTARQAQAVARMVQQQLGQGATEHAAAAAGRRHAARLLEYRSNLIARTEAVRYTNDLVELRARDVGRPVVKQWVSARDANVDGGRPLGPCNVNDNDQQIPLDGQFPSGHEKPPAHPGCRCVLEIFVVGG